MKDCELLRQIIIKQRESRRQAKLPNEDELRRELSSDLTVSSDQSPNLDQLRVFYDVPLLLECINQNLKLDEDIKIDLQYNQSLKSHPKTQIRQRVDSVSFTRKIIELESSIKQKEVTSNFLSACETRPKRKEQQCPEYDLMQSAEYQISSFKEDTSQLIEINNQPTFYHQDTIGLEMINYFPSNNALKGTLFKEPSLELETQIKQQELRVLQKQIEPVSCVSRCNREYSTNNRKLLSMQIIDTNGRFLSSGLTSDYWNKCHKKSNPYDRRTINDYIEKKKRLKQQQKQIEEAQKRERPERIRHNLKRLQEKALEIRKSFKTTPSKTLTLNKANSFSNEENTDKIVRQMEFKPMMDYHSFNDVFNCYVMKTMLYEYPNLLEDQFEEEYKALPNLSRSNSRFFGRQLTTKKLGLLSDQNGQIAIRNANTSLVECETFTVSYGTRDSLSSSVEIEEIESTSSDEICPQLTDHESSSSNRPDLSDEESNRNSPLSGGGEHWARMSPEENLSETPIPNWDELCQRVFRLESPSCAIGGSAIFSDERLAILSQLKHYRTQRDLCHYNSHSREDNPAMFAHHDEIIYVRCHDSSKHSYQIKSKQYDTKSADNHLSSYHSGAKSPAGMFGLTSDNQCNGWSSDVLVEPVSAFDQFYNTYTPTKESVNHSLPAESRLESLYDFNYRNFVSEKARKIFTFCDQLMRNKHLLTEVDFQKSIAQLDLSDFRTNHSPTRIFLVDLCREVVLNTFSMSPSEELTLLLPLRMQRYSWPQNVDKFVAVVLERFESALANATQSSSVMCDSRQCTPGAYATRPHQHQLSKRFGFLPEMDFLHSILYQEMLQDRWCYFGPEIREIKHAIAESILDQIIEGVVRQEVNLQTPQHIS